MPRKINISNRTENRIFPRLEHIIPAASFKIKYSEHHKVLAEYLNNCLDKKWLIYVKPHLQGLRPDIILLHPTKGMLILLIKDWKDDNLEKYEWEQKKLDDKNRNIYSLDGMDIPEPGSDLEKIKDRIIFQLIPSLKIFFDSLEGKLQDKFNLRKKFCAIRTGYYFPKISKTNDIKERLQKLGPTKRKKLLLLSNEEIINNKDFNIHIDIYDKERKADEDIPKYWDKELLNTIKTELTPSYHKIEHGTPINITEEQKRYIKSKPGRTEILKGVAGSGKSLIIGQRAARIASKGRSVLILTFNITLINYLDEQVKRAQVGFANDLIDIMHFHGLCTQLERKYERRLSYYSDIQAEENYSDSIEEFYNRKLPKFWSNYFESHEDHIHQKYDAILIDEAQDYSREMYEMLKYVKNDNRAETLIVYDYKQNIYNKSLNWIHEQADIISKLNQSHRIPEILIPIVNKFAELYLNEEEHSDIESGVQQTLPFFRDNLVWVEMNKIIQDRSEFDSNQNEKNICKDCEIEKVPFLDYLTSWRDKTAKYNNNLENNFITDSVLNHIAENKYKSNEKLSEIGIDINIVKKYANDLIRIIQKERCKTCERNFILCENMIMEKVKEITEQGNNKQDIAILVPFHREAKSITKLLNDNGYETIGINSRREKLQFNRMDTGIKISTIHSFKGYEITNLIILTELTEISFFKTHKIMYTSLTRSTNKSVFLNRNRQYEEFGRYLEEYKASLNIS